MLGLLGALVFHLVAWRAWVQSDRAWAMQALSRTYLALAQDLALYGERHPKVAGDLVNLGAALANQGRPSEAEALTRRSFELRGELLGPDHRDTLTSQSHLANQLAALGRGAEAEALLREVLDRRRAAGPLDHPDAARDP